MELKYGMELEIAVNPIEYNFMGMFGISSSNSEKVKTRFTVEKYRDSDTNPNSYKVKCVPIDKSGLFGVEKFYSYDLSNMIERCQIKVIENDKTK